MLRSFLAAIGFSVALASPVFAECVDLTSSDSFTLTRTTPLFQVTNAISDDGTITAVREMRRTNAIEQVTTTYWNGVIAIDRKSAASHIQVQIDPAAKAANLREVGKTYRYPITIFVNGAQADEGFFLMNTVEEATLDIDGCSYAIMVVRTSLERNNGAPINEEALLSIDAGMLLGNVAMTTDWQPKTGVFFDEIRAN